MVFWLIRIYYCVGKTVHHWHRWQGRRGQRWWKETRRGRRKRRRCRRTRTWLTPSIMLRPSAPVTVPSSSPTSSTTSPLLVKFLLVSHYKFMINVSQQFHFKICLCDQRVNYFMSKNQIFEEPIWENHLGLLNHCCNNFWFDASYIKSSSRTHTWFEGLWGEHWIIYILQIDVSLFSSLENLVQDLYNRTVSPINEKCHRFDLKFSIQRLILIGESNINFSLAN